MSTPHLESLPLVAGAQKMNLHYSWLPIALLPELRQAAATHAFPSEGNKSSNPVHGPCGGSLWLQEQGLAQWIWNKNSVALTGITKIYDVSFLQWINRRKVAISKI